MALFDPLDIRGTRIRNRIAVSPMCQYSCEGYDGLAGDWHLVHLGSLARGGAGLVFTEAAAVESRGRIAREDLGFWDERHVEALARAVRFVSAQGAVPGIQLAHAGRKASVFRTWDDRHGSVPLGEGGWATVGPSAVPFGQLRAPQELERDSIARVVDAFGSAAERALRAGFRAIELHAAHGYLLHEFLSPLSNLRRDEYGGDLEGRMRLTIEVVDAIRRSWPEELPLFVRISATDYAESGGWDVEQSVELARRLAGHGVDVVDCSSGGMLPSANIPQGPGYQTGFAAQVRREAGVRTMAVGFITEPQQADTIIRSGQADLVALARAILRNPNWPLHAARALGESMLPGDTTAPPPQYRRAWFI